MGQHIDLTQFDWGARSEVWQALAQELFPGLLVQLDPRASLRGSIDSVELGAAQLCTIETPPALAQYVPDKAHSRRWQHVSLMVLPWGSVCVGCGNDEITLKPGDMCLIDERERFRLTTHEFSRLLFLRLPRAPVLSRYPHLFRLCGQILPASDCGTRLLSENLQRISEVAHALSDLQRDAVVGSVIQMLGVAQAFSTLPQSAEWRVRRADDFIDMNLSVAGLTAEDVARDQSISRRRLDQLMKEAHGQSIAGHLWQQRMIRAAADLRDPYKATLSIAQIAFANGYEDAAHFTRAFRRSYGITPGRWREGDAGA